MADVDAEAETGARAMAVAEGEGEAEAGAVAGAGAEARPSSPSIWRGTRKRRQQMMRKATTTGEQTSTMMTVKEKVSKDISPGVSAAARSYDAVNTTVRCQWSLRGECLPLEDEMQRHLSVALIDNLMSAIAASAAVFSRVTSWC